MSVCVFSVESFFLDLHGGTVRQMHYDPLTFFAILSVFVLLSQKDVGL